MLRYALRPFAEAWDLCATILEAPLYYGGLLRLRLVCSRWSQVIAADAALWNVITARLPENARQSLLKRSSPHKLLVGAFAFDFRGKKERRAFSSDISSQSKRWLALQIICSESLERWTLELLNCPLDSLEVLHILGPRLTERRLDFLGGNSCDTIRSLNLDSFNVSFAEGQSFRGLERFDMQLPKSVDLLPWESGLHFLAWLSGLPRLQTFRLNSYDGSENFGLTSADEENKIGYSRKWTASLPHLLSFEACGLPASVVEVVLRHATSGLREIRLDVADINHGTTTELIQAFAKAVDRGRIACGPHSISIRTNYVGIEDTLHGAFELRLSQPHHNHHSTQIIDVLLQSLLETCSPHYFSSVTQLSSEEFHDDARIPLRIFDLLDRTCPIIRRWSTGCSVSDRSAFEVIGPRVVDGVNRRILSRLEDIHVSFCPRLETFQLSEVIDDRKVAGIPIKKLDIATIDYAWGAERNAMARDLMKLVNEMED